MSDNDWMNEGSAFYIGGRDTDIEQIGCTLYCLIREAYLINKVPPHIMAMLDKLQDHLETASKEIQMLIEMVTSDLETDNESAEKG